MLPQRVRPCRVARLVFSVLVVLTACHEGGIELPTAASGSLTATVGRGGYAMVDLGTLGGHYSEARGIGPNAQVVGMSATADQYPHGVLWDRGAIIDLGPDLVPQAISARGQIVGNFLELYVGQQAFVWERGQLTVLQTLGGWAAEARDINANGDIVGYATTETGRGRAVMWSKGTVLDLLGSDTSTAVATAINASGQIVGYASASITGAFLWDRGVLTNLGTLGGGPVVPTGINGRGQVVGWSRTGGVPGVAHAFVWDAGSMRDLGPPGSVSVAEGIDDQGRVVGWASFNGLEAHAVVWERGAIVDLGTPGLASYAIEISSDGQIVGFTQVPGAVFTYHAVIWTPLSGPSTSPGGR